MMIALGIISLVAGASVMTSFVVKMWGYYATGGEGEETWENMETGGTAETTWQDLES